MCESTLLFTVAKSITLFVFIMSNMFKMSMYHSWNDIDKGK